MATRARDEKYIKAVYDHYGRVCKCCGERERMFLSIDHINNDGAEQRREMGKAGKGMGLYRWIVRNNFPDFLQTLCMNCNSGKHRNGGVCPHKQRQAKTPVEEGPIQGESSSSLASQCLPQGF